MRDNVGEENLPDLTQEAEAERWIRSIPQSFCNTQDADLLRQVLNDYDWETKNFYRWRHYIPAADLQRLLREKTGEDFGCILDLLPVERGASGRLVKLRIVGEKQTMVVGKELEIRRVLSDTHLYSSAFVVEKAGLDERGHPLGFMLHGAGWGHGVGMCQIGAAVMSHEGYKFNEILEHYYKGADIIKLY